MLYFDGLIVLFYFIEEVKEVRIERLKKFFFLVVSVSVSDD